MNEHSEKRILRKPDWIKVRLGGGEGFTRMQHIVEDGKLHTVCSEALCPNKGECWQHGRATLMILGDICSRGCAFCGVTSQRPSAVDRDEPANVAQAVKQMGLSDVVITSVTRDDLEDGGSSVWVETIQQVRSAVPEISIEVLVPDFAGNQTALLSVIQERPTVFGHNLETVKRLYSVARPEADYKRSLDVLRCSRDGGLITKTGIMLGLGETLDEVCELMRDARQAGVQVFYAGQYLQPSRDHLAVERYVEPQEFEQIAEQGREIGFEVVVSAPLVRSSYHSDEQAEFVKEHLRDEL